MSVEITPELERLIQSIKQDGGYDDESEVLTEALQLLKNRDRLRSEIAEGIAQLDRGERIVAESVFAELDDKVAKLPQP